MMVSNIGGSTCSSGDGGGEEELSEIWMPMAEAIMKGIFNRLMMHRWGAFVAYVESP
jgi:hypothetical protein